MNESSFQPVVIQADCNTVIRLITQELSAAGFVILESFDFQSARAAHPGCTCPQHGTEQCTCQLVVLLVHNERTPPVTLTIHGNDFITELTVVPNLLPNSGEKLKINILGVIKPCLSTLLNQESLTEIFKLSTLTE